MRNISKAFEEFATKRCEEILTNDKECEVFNQKLIDAEKELKKTMSKEQAEKFEEYIDTVLKFNAYCEKLMYIQGFNDRIAVF
mgnify:CR=1 FL=1